MEKPENDTHDTHPITVYVLPYGDKDSEISFAELLSILFLRKWIIISSMLVAIMLAATYVNLVQPRYQAKAALLPPQELDIQGLVVDFSGADEIQVKHYTPELVYAAFLQNLKSKGLRREFFDTQKLAEHYFSGVAYSNEEVDRLFDTQFNVDLNVQVGAQDGEFVFASFVYSDPRLAAELLNQFIAFANKRTVDQLAANVTSVIDSEIEKISYRMISKLKLGEKRRHDRIQALREALQLAKSLGINESTARSRVSTNEQPGNSEDYMSPFVLSMRGEQALEVEIAVLESRKSDEPFVDGVRDLQEMKTFLESISIDRSKLSAVKIDVAATPPYEAQALRKVRLIALAAMVGAMMGILLVFVAQMRPSLSRKSGSY